MACIAIIVSVARDIILDIIGAKKPVTACPEPDPEPEPEPVIEENEIIPETVITEIVIEETSNDVEVVDVQWAEHKGTDKAYRYSPNGIDVKIGDTVLVPTFDAHKNGEIARKATVFGDVYHIDPKELHYHLKPILRIIEDDNPAKI